MSVEFLIYFTFIKMLSDRGISLKDAIFQLESLNKLKTDLTKATNNSTHKYGITLN